MSMDPTREQLAALARQLAATAPEEINCDTVLDRVAAYLEATADDADIPAELTIVGQHLEVCPACLEEFQALVRAAQAE